MITYDILDAENLVRIRYEGSLDDAMMVEAYRSLYADPRWRPGMAEFVDVRGSDPKGVTLTGLSAVSKITAAALGEGGEAGRTAVVISKDVGFGMARMYEAVAMMVETVQIFRDPDEAMAWLGGGAAED